MDNRRGRQHNFGTQRRSCFRVCIALAVVSMALCFLSCRPSAVAPRGRGARDGLQERSAIIVDVRARRAAASAPACGPTPAGKGHAGVKQGPTLDGLARRRGPTLAGKGRAGVKGLRSTGWPKVSRANAGGRGPRWRQGSTLDGLAEGVEGQRWRARAALAPRANQTSRRHRAPHVRCAPRGARRRCRRISRSEAVPSHAPAPQDVPRPARWRSTGGNLSACPAFAVPASARGATAALRRAPGSSPGPSAAGRDGSAGLPRRRRSRERAQVAGAGGTRQAWLRVEALEVTRDTRGREGPRGMWMWSGVRVVRADASCAPRGGSAQRWSALAACDQGWCWPLAMAPQCRDARERRGVTDRPRSRAAVHAV